MKIYWWTNGLIHVPHSTVCSYQASISCDWLEWEKRCRRWGLCYWRTPAVSQAIRVETPHYNGDYAGESYTHPRNAALIMAALIPPSPSVPATQKTWHAISIAVLQLQVFRCGARLNTPNYHIQKIDIVCGVEYFQRKCGVLEHTRWNHMKLLLQFMLSIQKG